MFNFVIKMIIIFNKISPVKVIPVNFTGKMQYLVIEPSKKFEGVQLYRFTKLIPGFELELIAINLVFGGVSYITTNELFDSYMTEDEQKAIISHEIGHVHLGHLDQPGLLVDEASEKEADQYSMNLHGKSMKTALTKIRHGIYNKYILADEMPIEVINSIVGMLDDRIASL